MILLSLFTLCSGRYFWGILQHVRTSFNCKDALAVDAIYIFLYLYPHPLTATVKTVNHLENRKTREEWESIFNQNYIQPILQVAIITLVKEESLAWNSRLGWYVAMVQLTLSLKLVVKTILHFLFLLKGLEQRLNEALHLILSDDKVGKWVERITNFSDDKVCWYSASSVIRRCLGNRGCTVTHLWVLLLFYKILYLGGVLRVSTPHP